jgi:hypothetical protein
MGRRRRRTPWLRKYNIALTCNHNNSFKVITFVNYVIIFIIVYQICHNVLFRTLFPFHYLGTRNKVDNITSRLDFMNVALEESDNGHGFPVKFFVP